MAVRRNSTAASAKLFERARERLPGGVSRDTVFMAPHPLYAARGTGCRVVDVDGVERIDFANNYFSLIHGHAHPQIVATVTRVLAEGTAFGMPGTHEVELAERLHERNPGFEQTRFCNSGTEAVMHAVKAARALTGRPMIAKCEGAYHGGYDPVEISLDSAPANWGDADPASTPHVAGTPATQLAETLVIPFNDTAAARRLLARHGDALACLLLDLVPSRCGLIPIEPEFLQALREETAHRGIVLILDEVVSFRHAPGGAQKLFGLAPDLTVLGKIIGGGFPVGAVAGRRDFMRAFDPEHGGAPVPQGGTFAANPVTMSAGAVALDLYDENEVARLDRLGARLRDGLGAVAEAADGPMQVTGYGSMFRLHFTDRPVRDYRSAWQDETQAARCARLYRYLLDHGIMVTPNLSGALSTPMAEAEIDRLVATVEDGVSTIGD